MDGNDFKRRELVHPIQPGDEWKIEQGLAAYHMPLRDLTTSEDTGTDFPRKESKFSDIEQKRQGLADSLDIDREKEFAEERPGWRGYVEWEDYPKKKDRAAALFKEHDFPPPPEFQLGPIPDTNPVLEGVRWKLWHKAIGGRLTSMPEESWVTVIREKHADMLHLLEFPYNGEPPKRLVTAQAITPNELFFVRNHGGIPDIDADKWDVRIEGLVKEPQRLTLATLKNEEIFPRMKKKVTIQCSGTRRIEQIALYAGEGDEMINAPWAEGAIGNAIWEGVSLRHVIEYCGGLTSKAKHLEFSGADTYFKHGELMNYLVSVPWSKVRLDEVMLCFGMNGVDLPKIHGYPVRVLVFGYIGARSVKWLYRIRALEKPTRAPVQSKEYLYFNQQVGKHNQLPTMGIQIQEMPVSSAIMEPWMKQVVLHEGRILCKGWAYSGGGRWPERVELSNNGGFSWYPVPLENISKKHKFAWRTWEMWLPVDVEGWIEIVCRCWDNSLNTQPLEVRTTWNWGLHVTSSCHRVRIYSINKTREATRKRLQEFKDHGEELVPISRPTEFYPMTEDEYEQFWRDHDPRDVDD